MKSVGNSFEVAVLGLPGLPVEIERSDDLIQWNPWTNGVLSSGGGLEVFDENSGDESRRFYRVKGR